MSSAKTLNSKEARNQKRREEYANDESYRQTCTLVSRENYRRDNGVVLWSCLDNLDKLSQFGQVRDIHINDKRTVRERCFVVRELGEVLGYSPTILYRWKGKGLLPSPIFGARTTMYSDYRGSSFDSTLRVYIEAEVRAIIEVIGEHQKEFCYYRQSDTAVTEQLFAKVGQARKKYGG